MDTGVIQLYDSLEAQKTDSGAMNRNILRDERGLLGIMPSSPEVLGFYISFSV